MAETIDLASLDPAGPLTGDEIIPIVQGGATVRTTSDQLAEQLGIPASESADRAEAWADTAEDVEVPGNPGKYSAKHWAEKSADSAAGAAAAVANTGAEMRARLPLVEPENTLKQLIGTESIVDGNLFTNANTNIFTMPVLKKGNLGVITVWAKEVATLYVSHWAMVSGDLVFKGEVSLTLAVGSNTFALTDGTVGLLPIAAGEYVGLYATGGRLASATNSGGLPYWTVAGHNTTSFTPSAPITTIRIACKFEIIEEGEQTAWAREELDARCGLFEAGKYPSPVTIGTVTPVTGANLGTGRSYGINVATSHAGFTIGLRFFASLGGVGKLKLFNNDWSVFKGETYVRYSAGANNLRAWRDFRGLNFAAGDKFMWYSIWGILCVTVGGSPATPYYNPLGDIVAGFTPGVETTTNRIEFAIDTIQADDPPGVSSAELVAVPPVLYGLQGRQTNFYRGSVVYGHHTMYEWDEMGAALGVPQEERWTYTPGATPIDQDLIFTLLDPTTGIELDRATTRLKTAAYPPAGAKNWTVLTLGDSLVALGDITQGFLDLAAAPGSNTTITLIGTRGSGSNKHEGRGGYTVDDFATAGRIFQSFTVSGVVTPPEINTSEVAYTHNGRTYTPQDVILDVSGNGTIICSYTGGSAPSSSGTLTKVGSGLGDATINFSATAAASGNPLWNSGTSQLDPGNYLTVNGYADPTHVLILLGTNGPIGQASDAAVDARIALDIPKYETLVQSFLTHNPATKIVLMLTPRGCDFASAAGTNYNTGISKYRGKRNLMRWAQGMIDHFAGRTGEGIYLAATNVGIDPVFGYPTNKPLANSRARNLVQFTFQGVTTLPDLTSTTLTYTHNGRTYTPVAISQNVADPTDGAKRAGFLTMAYSGGMPPNAAGTLTKVGAGTGDGTITFVDSLDVSQTVQRGTNFVHPEKQGSYQLTDCCYACMHVVG